MCGFMGCWRLSAGIGMGGHKKSRILARGQGPPGSRAGGRSRLRQPLRPQHHQRHQRRQQHLAEREIKHRLFARLLFFMLDNLLGRSRFAFALAAFV